MAVAPESAQPPRDLRSAATAEWPARPFPAGLSWPAEGLPVVVRQSVLNAIHRHGQSRTDVEVCGVYVGNGYRDPRGPYLYVEGSIRGDHAASQAAQVTFTAETWSHIAAVLDSAWPEGRLLGWYHTHPGFGVFLSGMDLFIQEHFFGGHEHTALVYDPLSGQEGLFVWRDGEPAKAAFLIEPDEPEDPPRVPGATTPTAAAGDLADLARQVAHLRRRQRWLALWLLITLIIALKALL